MKLRKRFGIVCAVAGGLAISLLSTWTLCQGSPLGGTLRLSLGQQSVLDCPQPLEQVAVGDPKVADVKIVSQGRQILVTALGQGSTDLITWDTQGQQTKTLVQVVLKDVRMIQREVEAMLSGVEGIKVSRIEERVVIDGDVFTAGDMERIKKVAALYPEDVILLVRLSPTLTRLLAEEITRAMQKNGYLDVRATGVGDKIFLEGTVNRQEEGEEVSRLAGAYFENCVSLVRQAGRVEDLVLIDIRFVEVGQKLAEAIGVQWDRTARFEITSMDYTLNLLRSHVDSGVMEASGLNGFGANVNIGEQKMFARTLAHPKLVCKSGEKADFIAGGEIPIVIMLTDRFAVEYKDYGIMLHISPVVHSSGKVSAQVKAEVSTLDWANRVGDYPALKVRSVDTYVTLERDKLLALSGLVDQKDAKDVEKVPLIGDVPILGELFKSRYFTKDNSELVIFVSVQLMEAENGESQEMIRSVDDKFKSDKKLLSPSLFD